MAKVFSNLEYSMPNEFDPDDSNVDESDDSDLSEDDVEQKNHQAREHYQIVGESKLRKRQLPTLGPGYEGSRISRKDALQKDDIGSSSSDDNERLKDGDSSDAESLDSSHSGENAELSNKKKSRRNSLKIDDSSDSIMSGTDEVATDDMRNTSSIDRYPSSQSSIDEERDLARKEKEDRKEADSRAAVRKYLQEEQKIVADNVSRAVRADIEKGRAVMKQNATTDSLLNVRIKLQQALIASNSLALADEASEPNKSLEDKTSEEDPTKAASTSQDNHNTIHAAEEAVVSLWNSITALRANLLEARSGTSGTVGDDDSDDNTYPPPLSPTTPSSTFQQHIHAQERASLPTRHAILNKWSARLRHTNVSVASATASANRRRLNGVSSSSSTSHLASHTHSSHHHQQQALSALLTADLAPHSSSATRLLARTQNARACAPLHAKRGITVSAALYDDADFYGTLLQSFLEQQQQQQQNGRGRVSGSGSGNGIVGSNAISGADPLFAPRWQAAKAARVKKATDTRASKGRKLKYTVHEKLQDFMARENRGAWSDGRADELFGGLFGVRVRLDEGEGQEEDDDQDDDDYNDDHSHGKIDDDGDDGEEMEVDGRNGLGDAGLLLFGKG